MRTLIALVVLATMACPGAGLGTDAGSDAQAGKVKGSKTNTSERAGAGGEESPAKGVQEATTVNRTKSNSSDRKRGAGARSTTVNNSKSNNY
jgi:hypothetical protein